MNRMVVAAYILLGSVATAGAQQKGSSDLEAYLDGIRLSGISEVGRGQIAMISSICSGASILEYHKDEASGRYWPSYASAACPKPDADPPQIEQWKKLRRSEADLLVDKLKPYADTDASGFVTTAEASEFRDLVEFGYLVAQVNRDEGTSTTVIARASGYESAEVARKIKAYGTLAGRINDTGATTLPEVKLTVD